MEVLPYTVLTLTKGLRFFQAARTDISSYGFGSAAAQQWPMG